MSKCMRRLAVVILFAFLAGFLMSVSTTEARQGNPNRGNTIIIVVDNFDETPILTQLAQELDGSQVAQLIEQQSDVDFESLAATTQSTTDAIADRVAELSNGNATIAEDSNNGRGNSSNSDDTTIVFDEDENNCAVTLDSQIYAVRGAIYAVRGAGEETELSHGEQVVSIIEEQLTAAGVQDDVEIQTINITSLSTSALANELAVAIAENGTDNVVVNMSIAIVPCTDIPAMIAAEAYAEILLADENYDQIEQMQNVVSQYFENTISGVLDSDAVLATTASPNERALEVSNNPRFQPPNSLMFVAAAGNYGANFSFFPAAWDNVLSVSSSEDFQTSMQHQDVRAGYSNQGQLMVPLLPGSPYGTSFAAPRVTALFAILLETSGADAACGGTGLPAFLALDYTDTSLVDAFAQTCGDLASAVSTLGLDS